MSTILKALRQLEQDKPPEAADPFGDAVEPDPTATPARSAKRASGGSAGTVLGIALAGAGLLLIGLALQPMFRTANPVVASAALEVASVADEVPEVVRPRAAVAVISQPADLVADALIEEAEAEVDFAVLATADDVAGEIAEVPVAVVAPNAPPRAATPVVPGAAPGQSGAVAFVPAAGVEVAPAPPVVVAAAPAKPVADAAAPKPDVVAAPAKPVVVAAVVAPKPKVTAEPAKPALAAAVSAPPEPVPTNKPIATRKSQKALVSEISPKVAERAVEAEVASTADAALDAAALDFEEIRRPLDPPVLFPVQTSWHPKPDRREARLEAVSGKAQVVREGDDVDGYTVLEISPSAVVFERGGETVRVRVGAP